MTQPVSTGLTQTCEILECIILNKDGIEYDLLAEGSFISVDIFESVSNYFLTAQLILKDSRFIIENLPVLGGETIKFAFRDLNLQQEFKLEFLLYQFKVDEDENFYVFDLCSTEALEAINQRLSKKITGTVETVIQDLFSDPINSTKTFNAETTSNELEIFANYWTPSEIINFAVNTTDPPDILFYESVLDGFNIASLKTILGSAAVESYYNKELELQYNIINRVVRKEFLKKGNLIENSMNGALGNTVIKWNPTLNTFSTFGTVYSGIYEEKTTPLGLSTNVNPNVESTLSEVKLSFYNYETSSYRKIILNSIENTGIKIELPGKVRKAGTLIDYIWQDVGEHSLYSGKWMISDIRYRIANTEDFTMSLKLVKNAFWGSEKIGKNLTGANR